VRYGHLPKLISAQPADFGSEAHRNMSQALRNPLRWLARGVLCVAILGAAACGKKKASAPADSISIDQPHPPDLMPGATPLATLERTGCYGECPVYRLTVNTDGSVVYVGTRWVKVLGRQEYKITEAQLTELQSAFDRANFMVLHDYDRVESTDDDWAHLSFRRGTGFKRVRHYHGDNAAPQALSNLEDEFDRLVDSGRFVGLSAAASPSPPAAPPAPNAGDSTRPADSVKPVASTKSGEVVGPPDDPAADPDNHP
jgi:hypothetical protein